MDSQFFGHFRSWNVHNHFESVVDSQKTSTSNFVRIGIYLISALVLDKVFSHDDFISLEADTEEIAKGSPTASYHIKVNYGDLVVPKHIDGHRIF